VGKTLLILPAAAMGWMSEAKSIPERVVFNHGRLRRHKGWASETTQLASEANPTERVGKTLLILPAAAMGWMSEAKSIPERVVFPNFSLSSQK
jgi:hypothetical protein